MDLTSPPDPFEGDDPFEGLQLDEDFVRSAAIREPSARSRENVAAGQRAADEAAEERWLAHRARRRRRRLAVVSAVLVVSVMVGAIGWIDRSGNYQGTEAWTGADSTSSRPPLSKRPTPKEAPSRTPLGTPAPLERSSSAYRFLQSQDRGDDPVAYDPCRPIDVVINRRTAPPGGVEITRRALREVSRVTGLRFRLEDDDVDEKPSFERESVQTTRYGDRWAPVLIAWSDPDELPDLDEAVAGLGGSVPYPVGSPSTWVYTTGMIALDGPQVASLMERKGGREEAEDVVLHELGHLAGLDHVDDPSQLMYPTGQGDVAGYQAGDRTGLARLGRGTCFPLL